MTKEAKMNQEKLDTVVRILVGGSLAGSSTIVIVGLGGVDAGISLATLALGVLILAFPPNRR